MTTAAQSLAETFVRMLNEHDPDLVDQFVADNYRNHNAFVGDGREANRRFWAVFFAHLRSSEAISAVGLTGFEPATT